MGVGLTVHKGLGCFPTCPLLPQGPHRQTRPSSDKAPAPHLPRTDQVGLDSRPVLLQPNFIVTLGGGPSPEPAGPHP